MTLAPVFQAALILPPAGRPRWQYNRVTPRLIAEGEALTFTLRCLNAVPGAKVLLWMTGGNSAASDGNWLAKWNTVIGDGCAAAGCTAQKLSGSTTPATQGTVSWLITVGAGYQPGALMTFTNTTRRNRRNDATNPDGTPGYREMQVLLSAQSPSATYGTVANATPSGGVFVDIQDTSRRPTDTPTLQLKAYMPGTTLPAPVNMQEGDSLELVLVTANLVPGTQVKLYAANAAQYDVTPAFRTALERAAQGTPGVTAVIPRYTPATASTWFNGGTLTFGEDYDNAQPLRLTLTAKLDSEDEATEQLDIIGALVVDGDLSDFDQSASRGDWASGTRYQQGDWVTWTQDGATYVYLAEAASSGHQPDASDWWRPYNRTQTLGLGLSYQIRDVPARYWELRAMTDASTITYTVQGPANAAGDSVALSSINPPPGFDAALAAAAGDGAAIRSADGRLTASGVGPASSAISFAVPRPGGAGKHALRLSDPQGASPIVIEDACAYWSVPALPVDPDWIVGVNLSGGEFATDHLPGTYGTDYTYPSQPETAAPRTHQEMDYHWAHGVRIVRLPVRWERIQDGLFGALSGDGGTGGWSGRQDMRRVDEAIAYWTGLGGILLLDVHNYMAFSSVGRVGYDRPVPTAALADLWVRLAQRYAGNPRVWFGIMNEPSGDGATAIRTRDNMHSVVNAIRARSDALNRILVAGAGYSSASGWVKNGQAAAFQAFYDPAGNFAFEPHCYVDSDGSGTSGTCTTGAQNRLGDITAWARGAGFQLFLGECAGGDPAIAGQESCGAVVPALYDYMSSNRDVWRGWTTWGAGRRWTTSYPFRLDPTDYQAGADTGCMKLLLPYLAAA